MNRLALLGAQLLLLTSSLAACGSAQRASTAETCILAAADSALLKDGPVFRECAVDRPAKGLQTPFTWRPSAGSDSRTQNCFTADVQFVVSELGRVEPGTIKVVSTNLPDLASALLASVPYWTYQPALLGDRSVRQIVRVHRAVATIVVVTVAGQPRTPPRPPANCR